MVINLEEHLTENEVARRLGVVPRTIARWEAQGVIPPAIRLGPRLKKHHWPSVVKALGLDEATAGKEAANASR
ncbi:MAG: MerR family transcriptional regulator [Parvularcula sp.]|jgi:predicted site-specific integrase-resolvase|nr:MerR family transcriptional regulator [Parvularcula sp.]